MQTIEASMDSEVEKLLFLPLTNEQIRNYWGFVKQALKELDLTPLGVPGDDEEVYDGILTSLQDESMKCYLLFEKLDSKEDPEIGPQGKLLGMVLLYFAKDISGPKNLIVFAMGVLGAMGPQHWIFAIKKLQEVARKHQCVNILAQTKNASVVKFIESLGGNVDYTLLEIPVGE